MKHHFIPPVPRRIMRMQNRLILVSLKSPTLRLLAAKQAAKPRQFRLSPIRALPPHRLHQGPIARIKIVPNQRRNLVCDFMRSQSLHLKLPELPQEILATSESLQLHIYATRTVPLVRPELRRDASRRLCANSPQSRPRAPIPARPPST